LRLTSWAGILVPLSTSQVEHFVECCLKFRFSRMEFVSEGRKFTFDKVRVTCVLLGIDHILIQLKPLILIYR